MSSLVTGPRSTVVAFSAVTVLVSAAFWIAGWSLPGDVLVDGLPVSAGMFVAPAVAAYVVGLPPRTSPPSRLLTVPLLRRCLGWALLMPGILAGTYLAMRVTGQDVPGPRVSLPSVVVLGLVFTVSSLCEEVGWTRVLGATLLRRHRMLPTGLVVGALWAGLHVVPYLQAGRSWSWVAWQCVFTVAFRVLVVTAVVASGGEWSVAVVLHVSYDVAWASFPVGGSHYDPRYAAAGTALVAVLLLLHGRSRRRPAR